MVRQMFDLPNVLSFVGYTMAVRHKHISSQQMSDEVKAVVLHSFEEPLLFGNGVQGHARRIKGAVGVC